MFAGSPSTIMDSTTVGRRPKAASIMGDGEAANTAKTYANMYQIFANLHILPISLKSPYVYPGAIRLARSGAPIYSGSHNKRPPLRSGGGWPEPVCEGEAGVGNLDAFVSPKGGWPAVLGQSLLATELQISLNE